MQEHFFYFTFSGIEHMHVSQFQSTYSMRFLWDEILFHMPHHYDFCNQENFFVQVVCHWKISNLKCTKTWPWVLYYKWKIPHLMLCCWLKSKHRCKCKVKHKIVFRLCIKYPWHMNQSCLDMHPVPKIPISICICKYSKIWKCEKWKPF